MIKRMRERTCSISMMRILYNACWGGGCMEVEGGNEEGETGREGEREGIECGRVAKRHEERERGR